MATIREEASSSAPALRSLDELPVTVAVFDEHDQDVRDEQWRDWRRGGVGASDVAAVCGLSKWGSPWTVWGSKNGLLPDLESTPKMRAGKALEGAIGELFEHERGTYVRSAQLCVESTVNPVHRASLDGLEYDAPLAAGGLIGVVEKKNEASRGWDEIPPWYQTQGQWQMHVTGLDVCRFAVLHFGWDLRIYELFRDQADIDVMVEQVDRFWSEHVLAGVPPEVDDHDATSKALLALYPEGLGDAVAVDDIADELSKLVEAKREVKAAKARATAIENRIKERLGSADAEDGLVGGRLAVSWRTSTRKSYTVKESTQRTLRLHGEYREAS